MDHRLSNGDASKSSAPAEGTSGRQSQLASSEQEAAGSEPAAAEKLLRALQVCSSPKAYHHSVCRV